MSGLSSRILRTTAIVMASSITVSSVGFLKNILAAYFFGTSGDMDAYLVALLLPDMVMYLATTGAFNFVPLFAEESARSEEEAWAAAGKMISYWLLVLFVAVGIAVIFTPQLTTILAPGFTGLRRLETIGMSRVLLGMSVAVATARLFALILYAQRRFVAQAFSEAVFQIGSTLYLLVFFRWGVSSLVWGMVFGAFVQLLVISVSLRERRHQLRLSRDLRAPVVRKMLRLTLPVYVGYSGARLNTAINRAFASLLPAGGISSLQYAFALAEGPVTVVASSVAGAMFPFLSQQFADKEEDQASHHLGRALFALIAVFLPMAAGLCLLARPVVQLLLERGSFDAHSTDLTTTALRIYALGIVGMALDRVLPLAFYARQKATIPMHAGLVRVAVNALLCALLIPRLGLEGVALASVAATYIKMGLMLYLLRRILPEVPVREAARSLVRLLLAVLGMVMFVVPATHLGVAHDVHWDVRSLASLAGVVLLGVVSYGVSLASFCRDDFRDFSRLIRKEIGSLARRRRPSKESAATPKVGAGDLETLVRHLEPRLPAYFPEQPPPLSLRLVGKPLDFDSSRLFRLDVMSDGQLRQGLAVKVFRSGPRRRYDAERAPQRQYESLQEAAWLSRPGCPVRSPRALDLLPEFGALVMERVEGTRLLDWLASGESPGRDLALVQACGEWLRGFQRLREAGSCDPEIPAKMRYFLAQLALLARRGVRPDLLRSLEVEMLQRARALAGLSVPACYSHCDFSASNILVDRGGQLVVLDIGRRDQPGPAASDVTAFLVSLDTAPLHPLRWRLSRARIARLRAAFLHGYEGRPSEPSPLIRFLSVLCQVDKFCYYLQSYQTHSLRCQLVRRFFTRCLTLSLEGAGSLRPVHALLKGE